MDWRHGADLIVLREWAESFTPVTGALAPRADPAAICEWLARHLYAASLEGHPALGDFAREIRALALRARGYLDPLRERRLTIPCLGKFEDGDDCGHEIPLESAALIRCRDCGAEWSPLVLLRAHAPDGAWLPPGHAARVLAVSVRTLSRWARLGRIQRQGEQYDVLNVIGQR